MRSMRNHRAKPASNKPTKMPINSSMCTNFKNLVQRYMFRVQRYCTKRGKMKKRRNYRRKQNTITAI